MGKTQEMGAAPKLKSHRRKQQWPVKSHKKSDIGNEWKKTFAGSSHTKGTVLEEIGIEALMNLGYKIEKASIIKVARVTEQLDAAQAANSELEAELSRLKV